LDSALLVPPLPVPEQHGKKAQCERGLHHRMPCVARVRFGGPGQDQRR
jgi:hypothetical protein